MFEIPGEFFAIGTGDKIRPKNHVNMKPGEPQNTKQVPDKL
jgi:hypothetical protein